MLAKLPRDLGDLALLANLRQEGIFTCYEGELRQDGATLPVYVRGLPEGDMPSLDMIANLEVRTGNLQAVWHPFLTPVVGWRREDGEFFFVERAPEGVGLDGVLATLRQTGRSSPANVLLSIATQLCNAVEALHGTPGKATGANNLLHLALRPAAIRITTEGRGELGNYGLVRSPLPVGGREAIASAHLHSYLSPEQAGSIQKLLPASVILNDTGMPGGQMRAVSLDDFLAGWDDYGNFAVITEHGPLDAAGLTQRAAEQALV